MCPDLLLCGSVRRALCASGPVNSIAPDTDIHAKTCADDESRTDAVIRYPPTLRLLCVPAQGLHNWQTVWRYLHCGEQDMPRRAGMRLLTVMQTTYYKGAD